MAVPAGSYTRSYSTVFFEIEANKQLLVHKPDEVKG